MAVRSPEKWVVFIDTNIFLDFYRQGGESAARQLAALDRHKGVIITSEQVRMEFFKNRQKVIADSLTKMQRPSRMSVPPILADFGPAKTMQDNLEAAAAAYGEVRDRVEAIISDPGQHDTVYTNLRSLFDTPSALNLSAGHARRSEVLALARERFALGYPPRKSNDSACGDSINWEWIVACAKQEADANVLIVSRDGDYGVTASDSAILNDCLKLEFAQRVAGRRKVELTARLTTALRRLDEHVSVEDEREETRLLVQLPRFDLDRAGLQALRDAARERDGVPNWFNDLISDVSRLQNASAEPR